MTSLRLNNLAGDHTPVCAPLHPTLDNLLPEAALFYEGAGHDSFKLPALKGKSMTQLYIEIIESYGYAGRINSPRWLRQVSSRLRA